MISPNDPVVAVLNDLISINNDRAEGYKRAAIQTDQEELRSLFSEMASHSQRFRNELSEEVIQRDVEPAPTALREGFRIPMSVGAAAAVPSFESILISCDTGESAALESYRKALESGEHLPVRELIERQFLTLRDDHDAIRQLRIAQEAASPADVPDPPAEKISHQ